MPVVECHLPHRRGDDLICGVLRITLIDHSKNALWVELGLRGHLRTRDARPSAGLPHCRRGRRPRSPMRPGSRPRAPGRPRCSQSFSRKLRSKEMTAPGGLRSPDAFENYLPVVRQGGRKMPTAVKPSHAAGKDGRPSRSPGFSSAAPRSRGL